MEKMDLVKIIGQVFQPVGFKRRGNYWKLRSDEITKIVYLQRSIYGKHFYIYWGFNFNELEDSVLMHVFYRLGFVDESQNKELKSLLDLATDISEDERSEKLLLILHRLLKSEINRTNSTKDVINDLNQRGQLSNVPNKVKEFLSLKELAH